MPRSPFTARLLLAITVPTLLVACRGDSTKPLGKTQASEQEQRVLTSETYAVTTRGSREPANDGEKKAGWDVQASFSATDPGFIRIAGVGANFGLRGANEVVSRGDVIGSVARIDEATFNSMTVEQLRANYDVLIVTWASQPSLNVDWNTRLRPFLELGGGVLYEDPNNVADLSAVFTAGSGFVPCGQYTYASVPGLTDGLRTPSQLTCHHFTIASFDRSLFTPFITTTSGVVVGLYAEIPGGGRITITGPDPDYHSSSSNTFERDDYTLLVNEIRWVSRGVANLNNPPTVTLPDTYTGVEGEAIAFSATAADPDGDAVMYAWDFDGDGTVDSRDADPTHAFSDNGTYTVRVTVTDSKNASASTTASVVVANAPPVVTVGTDVNIPGGESLKLSGTFSDAGVNDGPWPYTVEWGDGSPNGTGELTSSGAPIAPEHTYAGPGTYRVLLSVKDKDGDVGVASLTAVVNNRPPVAKAGGNNTTGDAYLGAEGVDVAFNGSGSDPDGDALTFSWSFSDGGSATGASVSHAFPDNGTYTATLTVADSRGGSTSVEAPVTIANVSPTATFAQSATSTAEGRNFSLALPNPKDVAADLATLQFAFDCGSGYGSFGSSATATCPANDNGTLTLHAKVRDKDGGVSEYAGTIEVTNVPPTATFGNSGSPEEGSPFQLRLTNAFDPSSVDMAAGFDYAFDCGTGLGAFSRNATATCPTDDNGTRNLVAVIRDKDGGTTSYSGTLTVRNVPPIVALTTDNGQIISGQSATVTGTFSDPGVRDNPWTYVIDWANGTPTTGTLSSISNITSSKQYLRAGTYTVRLTVTDKDGGAGANSVSLVVNRLPVPLDIKPGSSNNPINLSTSSTDADAKIPVAILSSNSFDAHLVDIATVRLGQTQNAVKKSGSYMATFEDVNGDGRLDLVLHFDRATMIVNGDLSPSTTSLTLTADLTDGRQVVAQDVVTIVP